MPEGPSLVIAVEELAGFVGKRIVEVSGNTRQPKERLVGETIRDIFSFGKYLNFQFDDFALRIHFMLFGSLRVGEPRPNRDPRLTITVGQERQLSTTASGKHVDHDEDAAPLPTIYLYACSVQFIEDADLKSQYDFRTDIMSPQWDRAYAMKQVRALPPETTVDDVMMDQDIFKGVGNIIKNEVLWRLKLSPSTKLGDLTPRQVGRLVTDARAYSQRFYELKKQYILRKNYQIYRKGACPRGCETKIIHQKTGQRERMSHWCPKCQQ
jgi:endonuclease VIII